MQNFVNVCIFLSNFLAFIIFSNGVKTQLKYKGTTQSEELIDQALSFYLNCSANSYLSSVCVDSSLHGFPNYKLQKVQWKVTSHETSFPYEDSVGTLEPCIPQVQEYPLLLNSRAGPHFWMLTMFLQNCIRDLMVLKIKKGRLLPQKFTNHDTQLIISWREST